MGEKYVGSMSVKSVLVFVFLIVIDYINYAIRDSGSNRFGWLLLSGFLTIYLSWAVKEKTEKELERKNIVDILMVCLLFVGVLLVFLM